MTERFTVTDACNGYYLVDSVTGLEVCLGDGTDNPIGTVGTEEFRLAWEKDANESVREYFEVYFYHLDSLVIHDDDSGQYMDRYTVLVEPASFLERAQYPGKDLWVCLGLSVNCDSPQGFSQWGFAVPSEQLGKIVHFLDLPCVVQKHIAEMLEEEDNEQAQTL